MGGKAIATVVAALWLVACGSGESDSSSSSASTASGGGNSSTSQSSTGSVSRPAGWTEATHGQVDPDYATVFPSNTVLRMDITISSSNWQAMLDNMASISGRALPARSSLNSTGGGGGGAGCSAGDGLNDGENFFSSTPVWVPVTVQFNGNTWTYVGMRFKGNSSLSRSWNAGLYKLPFRFKMDEFEDTYPEIDDQRLYGFQKLSFSSAAMDKSFMREKVVGDLLREYGVPAARTVWVRVYINNGSGSQYFGLYTMTEIPDKPMLDSQFGDSDGNLYKPQGDGANWSPRSGYSTSVWQETFEKETNEDAADWSDVRNAVDALNASNRTSNAAAWRTNLETYFNVDKFLKWMSANAVLGNGDSYGFIAHNYFLYSYPQDNNRLNWIPWDHDLALTCSTLNVLYPSSSYTASAWPLYRYLLDDGTYNSTYRSYASAFLNSTQFNQANVYGRLDAAYALIQPYVTGSDGEQIGTRYSALDSTSEFSAALTTLKSVIATRRSNATATLNQ